MFTLYLTKHYKYTNNLPRLCEKSFGELQKMHEPVDMLGSDSCGLLSIIFCEAVDLKMTAILTNPDTIGEEAVEIV